MTLTALRRGRRPRLSGCSTWKARDTEVGDLRLRIAFVQIPTGRGHRDLPPEIRPHLAAVHARRARRARRLHPRTDGRIAHRRGADAGKPCRSFAERSAGYGRLGLSFNDDWTRLAGESDLLLVTYEDLHRDPARQLTRVAAHITGSEPDPAAVAAAVRASQFSRIRAQRPGTGTVRRGPDSRRSSRPIELQKRRGWWLARLFRSGRCRICGGGHEPVLRSEFPRPAQPMNPLPAGRARAGAVRATRWCVRQNALRQPGHRPS